MLPVLGKARSRSALSSPSFPFENMPVCAAKPVPWSIGLLLSKIADAVPAERSETRSSPRHSPPPSRPHRHLELRNRRQANPMARPLNRDKDCVWPQSSHLAISAELAHVTTNPQQSFQARLEKSSRHGNLQFYATDELQARTTHGHAISASRLNALGLKDVVAVIDQTCFVFDLAADWRRPSVGGLGPASRGMMIRRCVGNARW